jgi:hypothetical protein
MGSGLLLWRVWRSHARRVTTLYSVGPALAMGPPLFTYRPIYYRPINTYLYWQSFIYADGCSKSRKKKEKQKKQNLSLGWVEPLAPWLLINCCLEVSHCVIGLKWLYYLYSLSVILVPWSVRFWWLAFC